MTPLAKPIKESRSQWSDLVWSGAPVRGKVESQGKWVKSVLKSSNLRRGCAIESKMPRTRLNR